MACAMATQKKKRAGNEIMGSIPFIFFLVLARTKQEQGKKRAGKRQFGTPSLAPTPRKISSSSPSHPLFA